MFLFRIWPQVLLKKNSSNRFALITAAFVCVRRVSLMKKVGIATAVGDEMGVLALQRKTEHKDTVPLRKTNK